MRSQIDESRIDNLSGFLEFARAALRKYKVEEGIDICCDTERPFHDLEFLVRDWAHFGSGMSMAECDAQASTHGKKFFDHPRSGSSAELVNSVFESVRISCLPHPGIRFLNEGSLADLDQDFVRFVDSYVRRVTAVTKPLVLFGNDVTPPMFCSLVENFAGSFHTAAPDALSFYQAMKLSTELLAKEKIVNTYRKRMGHIWG